MTPRKANGEMTHRQILVVFSGLMLGMLLAALEVVAAAPPPTLVLWGGDDARLTPAYGARVAAIIPGATWVPVADAGHLLPVERPERVAEEIAGFLSELPAASTSAPMVG